ncbi:MAG: hypothetical protein QW360_03535 [Thermofilum sp.]
MTVREPRASRSRQSGACRGEKRGAFQTKRMGYDAAPPTSKCGAAQGV